MVSDIRWRCHIKLIGGHSKRIHLIAFAAISRIFLKFGVYVKERHPIWSLKGFFKILIREKVMEF